MFKPRLGVSLHFIAKERTPKEFETLANSSIETFEVISDFFDNDPDGTIKANAKQILLCGENPKLASLHATFGESADLATLDENIRRCAVEGAVKEVELATEMQAPIVVFHAGAEPIEENERPRRIQQLCKSFKEIAERCRNAHRRIAIELLPRTCPANTVDELFDILSELDNDVFGVCLDVNHAMDRAAELPAYIRRLGDKLTTLHLSDYDNVDEKHWMPGKGVIDWKSVLEALGDIGYNGPFNYECWPEGDTIEERIKSLEENFAWLSNL